MLILLCYSGLLLILFLPFVVPFLFSLVFVALFFFFFDLFLFSPLFLFKLIIKNGKWEIILLKNKDSIHSGTKRTWFV